MSGVSPTARAFDAQINTGGGGNALFYVVARSGVPDAAVASVGGAVVTRLTSSRHALALAPLAAHAELRSHRQLEIAGPVTVDSERFARFARLAGMGGRPPPA